MNLLINIPDKYNLDGIDYNLLRVKTDIEEADASMVSDKECVDLIRMLRDAINEGEVIEDHLIDAKKIDFKESDFDTYRDYCVAMNEVEKAYYTKDDPECRTADC